jgi:hypothetical protein
MTLRITDGEYVYEHESGFLGAEPAAYMGIVAIVGEALIDLNKRIEEHVKTHELYQYWDNAYVQEIVIRIEGIPAGVVTLLDDFPQYLPLKQHNPLTRISEADPERVQAELQ